MILATCLPDALAQRGAPLYRKCELAFFASNFHRHRSVYAVSFGRGLRRLVSEPIGSMTEQSRESQPSNPVKSAAPEPSIPANAGPQLDLRGHLPVLDGIRGLAILMVLLLHFVGNMIPTNSIERVIVGVTNYGSYGVDLFFILSGFLITGILFDARNKPHYFRNFYMRRVLRIFPLYYGVLALVFIVAPLIPIFQGKTLDYLVDRQAWAWLYGVNVYIAIQGDWSFSYLEHLWSLCVEEHFYFVWPVVVFLLVARWPRTLIAVCLAIALGAMLARLAGSLHGAELVDHLRPDAVSSRRPGARCLPCGGDAPARRTGAAGACPAPRRGRGLHHCSW